jgi:uncharacterized protein Yka (UPF0111/DUF47 family)
MPPISDIVAVLSLLLAALVFAVGQRKDGRASAAQDQLVRDKLDRNNELARDTRDTVREMSRKLDDHGERIVRVEQRVDALEQRADRIENK